MKKNSKRTKKIRNLVFVCILSAILLTVSTYAWFIGMQTVRVNSFDVKIATTEGLMLSLDGETWTTELDTVTAPQYSGHQNQWLTTRDATEYLEAGGKGLIPMSTVGDIDASKNKLTLFEKGSLTATAGGYRLLASEVTNTASKEADGYLAFDLFIRNMSGEEYYSDYNLENEEAIYLTYDSDVKVGTSGTNNTGIENSVRVAFAQIGRVENQEYKTNDETYPVSTVTGITCEDTTDDDGNAIVTSICKRTATIWEPNDTNHITNAAKWYDESCSLRTTGTKFTYTPKTESTETHCNTVAEGTTYPTYAISRAINVDDYVDIYDGLSYNKYAANTVEPKGTSGATTTYDTYMTAKAEGPLDDEDAEAYKLVAVDTFTETERGIAGNPDTPTGANRNVFMTLAPNSITKVRVYVYIEGQDVDNYDFAQLGKAIQVNFGFTKERYTTDDYTDEPVELIPGAENMTKIAYAPAVEGVEVSAPTADNGTAMIWDAETKAFYHHEKQSVTKFTFTETKGEETKTVTAEYKNGTWATEGAFVAE